MEEGTQRWVGNMEVTVSLPVTCDELCPVRDILAWVGDKWSTLVISNLACGPMRFNALRRKIDGISQRMLTETLKKLEWNGVVSRTVYPTIPPKVEYALTPLGETLVAPVQTLVNWALEHRSEIQSARQNYEKAQATPPQPFVRPAE